MLHKPGEPFRHVLGVRPFFPLVHIAAAVNAGARAAKGRRLHGSYPLLFGHHGGFPDGQLLFIPR